MNTIKGIFIFVGTILLIFIFGAIYVDSSTGTHPVPVIQPRPVVWTHVGWLDKNKRVETLRTRGCTALINHDTGHIAIGCDY